MDFEFQTEVWTSPKMRIWTLVQGFNSKDFELQIKDNLGTKDLGSRNLNSTRDLNSKKALNLFKEWKFDNKDFEVLSELTNWHGWKWNLNQRIWFKSKNIQIPRQGFDFPNLKRYKPFQNRKLEIWS
jgi:hypothetical protein